VELQVRDARLTDVDRLMSLIERADARWTHDRLNDAADVLRQMLYLPNASVIVCLDGRMVLGLGVLAMRPSVSATGLVGTIDLLAFEPGHELDGAIDTLLTELVRQARNKGCVELEGPVPVEPGELGRWESVGFIESGPRLSLPLKRSAVPSW
jgi:N-acetylglutamate synthase-like GNAT family acetyltransferase